MKQPQLQISNFGGGMDSELRGTASNKFWYSENLDTGQNQHSLKQIISNQAENSNSYNTGFSIVKMIEVGSTVFGLGQDLVNQRTTLYKKSNVLTDNWTAIVTNTNGGFIANDPLLVSDGTYVYFDTGGPGSTYYIGQHTIGSSTNLTWSSSPDGNMKGGVIGSDGIPYGYIGHKIYKIVSTTSVDLNITPALSTNQTIVQVVAYQNYLAIFCTATAEPSKMYLCDKGIGNPAVDVADIGLGNVSGGCVQDGSLFTVLSFKNNRGFRIKQYSGGQFTTVYTYIGRYNRSGNNNFGFPVSYLKAYSGWAYFIIQLSRPDSTVENYEWAIARFGRKDSSLPYSFSIFKTLNTTSSTTYASTGNDFLIIEDLISNPASSQPILAIYAVIQNLVSATTFFASSTGTYTEAGVYESFKMNFGDSTTSKQLDVISTQFAPLTSSGSIILKYKKDEETNWTTLFTDTELNNISHDCRKVEPTGANLPIFKEIQFRLEINGGAELTGYKFKVNPLNDLYGS